MTNFSIVDTDADVVAAAIVAACRETGDDPVALATERFEVVLRDDEKDQSRGLHRHFRARFYVFAALRARFPLWSAEETARCLGPVKWSSFFASFSVMKHATWFDYDAASRVCDAIGGDVGRLAAMIPTKLNRKRRLVPPTWVGKWVWHAKFGNGLVMNDDANGVGVRFANGRVRRVHRSFVRLTTSLDPVPAPAQAEPTPAKLPAVTAPAPEPARSDRVTSLADARRVAVRRDSKNLPTLSKMVESEWSRLTLRHVDVTGDPATRVTEDFTGDPAPQRSALAAAEPWRPYEERARTKEFF